MRALVIRGLAARKVRAALTALAVVLGVAMVSGSYVLTDTINHSFDAIFRQGEASVDVEVTPHETIHSDEGPAQPPPFPEAMLDRVKQVDGVDIADGGIFDLVNILGKDGKPIQTHGAPNFITSVTPPRMDPFKYVQGRPPKTDTEVALDKFTSDRHHFRIGESIGIAGHVPARHYKLVGIAKFGDVASFGGASVAVVSLKQAQLLAGTVGKLESIQVAKSPGVDEQVLKRRIRAVLPPSVDVRTGKEQAAKLSKDNRESFGFLTTILLAFAFVALFVGAFIIFNTFSITVTQRTREFAMLRTLGASRRQVLGAVFAEALFIGLVSSGLGLLAGIGYAKGINGLFKAIGVDLPSSGTVILSRTIIVAVAIGIGVTLLAAMSPALRATRVAPLEALREGMGAQPGPRRRRYAIGAALSLIGLGAMMYALFGVEDSGDALSLIGLAAIVVFLGVAMLSPRLVLPLASLAGAPLERLRGLTGRLARENAVRNPGRTAVTAASLMIGLALVTFVTVFAEGLKRGIADAVDKNFRGDFVLQNKNGFAPIAAAAGQAVARLDGVELVSPWRISLGRISGVHGKKDVTGLDPGTAADVIGLEWEKGSRAVMARLRPGQAIADKKFAKKNHLDVGSTVTVTTPLAKHLRLEIVGTVKDTADFLGDLVVPVSVVERDFGERQDQIAVVKLAAGASLPKVRHEIAALLARDFPIVESLNQRELKDRQAEQFNQLLGLIYALLSLAVIVSIFGIVNTLVLTIHERTRELGLLRAVGMSRRQVRRLIRYESVITALIGGILGTLLGVLFALVISRPIADEGFVLAIPILSILSFLVLAGLAGVIAAIPPARRASRLDVLEALAYE